MKKFFFTVISVFLVISCSISANSEENGGASPIKAIGQDETPVSAPVKEEATAAEASAPEAVSQAAPTDTTAVMETIETIEAIETVEAAKAIESTEEIPTANKSADSDGIVLIDDAVPEGSTTGGTWGWDTSLKYSGEKSHTESAAKGITEHSYRTSPMVIPANSVIEQYVYLDPDNMPKGIMLKFGFENDSGEDEIGIYREGEEEVFVFNNDEPMLYDGTLPDAGKWEKLQIYCDDLGLVGAKLTGISFVTYGGRAYWDMTSIRAAKEREQFPPEE